MQHIPVSSYAPVVRIIDDDPDIRRALVDLLKSVDIEAVAYESPKALQASDDLLSAGCLVLDVRLSGMSGLDFQSALQRDGNRIPVIVMTGHADIPMSVRAMKAGAIDFLTKPFRDQDLIDAVAGAIERDEVLRKESQSRTALEKLLDSLTPREREVMKAVVNGSMNKQIAAEFGISQVTVKLHRSNVMRKMQARSLADLVRKAEILNYS
ncbi:response regulator transcription factor [Rhizobium sp. AB2/73]|uniref:response regulator transcription factor n=1 Tax=Rhizobium sp. AB2/73 TaxID=2795216 RepID=UPI000DDBF0E8|nr:response regulator transcription factor [Rhizobium sp. AB2/73]QYA17464.1 response regulator transcription factor [Rhizobium sp. AB2/73]UEQ85785.1 response regulator transcription factor [Rhizobium sp. AB2/73]